MTQRYAEGNRSIFAFNRASFVLFGFGRLEYTILISPLNKAKVQEGNLMIKRWIYPEIESDWLNQSSVSKISLTTCIICIWDVHSNVAHVTMTDDFLKYVYRKDQAYSSSQIQCMV